MKIGSNIRKVRKQLELSQDAVIKNCKLKISQATLSKIENDTLPVDPSSARFLDIAHAMGVEPLNIINYSHPSPSIPGKVSAGTPDTQTFLQDIHEQLVSVKQAQEEMYTYFTDLFKHLSGSTPGTTG